MQISCLTSLRKEGWVLSTARKQLSFVPELILYQHLTQHGRTNKTQHHLSVWFLSSLPILCILYPWQNSTISLGFLLFSSNLANQQAYDFGLTTYVKSFFFLCHFSVDSWCFAWVKILLGHSLPSFYTRKKYPFWIGNMILLTRMIEWVSPSIYHHLFSWHRKKLISKCTMVYFVIFLQGQAGHSRSSV